MDIPKLENLNASNCTERSIFLHYFEFWRYLTNNYSKELKWTEKLYWYYHGLEEHPKCKICGSNTKFINLKNGYRKFCSYKCMNSCKDIQERKKITCIKNYGVSNPMHSVECKKKLKQTNLERFGVDNPFKSTEIKEKIKQTNLENLGVEYPTQSQEIINKSKQTCLNRYGVEYNSQIPKVKEHKKSIQIETNKKQSVTFRENYLKNHQNIIDFDDDNYLCKCPHPDCNKSCDKTFLIPKQIYHSRRPQNIEICTKLLPINTLLKGTSLELFIRNLLDKYGIEYETNTRDIISPQEVDIYIPSKKIAIECNGIYYHSSDSKEKNYHYLKYISCKNQGVQLLTIWEDWIKNKPNVVESIILSKLGIYNERIYARKCSIRQISSTESNELLNKYHIQGGCPSQVRYGLYCNDKLLSVMSFSKKRNLIIGSNGNNEWELVRLCSAGGIQIIGGAEKLLKHFIEDYNPTSIYSFSSNDISNGNVYNKLGFIQTSKNDSYWYIDSKSYKRYHRSSFTKQSIIERGWKESKEGWKEADVMNEHGYFQIYDSGQTKWVMNI